MPEIVYVGGYGRSGSTVLDILLGNSEAIYGMGEGTRIFLMLAGDVQSHCSCGKPLSSCPFWQRVISCCEHQGLDEWPRIARIQRQVEGIGDFTALVRGDFSSGGVRETTGNLYRQYMRALFGAIRTTSGCQSVVDSSKTTWSTIGRPLALMKLCGFKVKMVHLIRDGRAVMWSGCRGTNTALARGPQKVSLGRGYKTALSWAMVNVLTSMMMRFLFAPQHFMTLHYEDLVANPAAATNRLSRFLDIDLHDVKERLDRGDSLQVSHLVGGNRVARKSHIRLHAEDEWRQKLPVTGKYLYWFSLWPVVLIYRRRNASRPFDRD
ncbi:MAG TPA: sulfotransferase [Anaerolineae bacterium]